ncbi:MAG: nuclear transport factor 2 family protein [Candidatus Aminicenantes bacterium]|nr:nuclear transport factor 2 family protein [Candidatus Aminicenantes bacterium]
MKKIWTLFLVVLLSAGWIAAADTIDETEAVKNAVVEGYIEGIFLKGDPELVKKGWHEKCDIVVYMNKQFHKIPVSAWIERLEKKSGPPHPEIKVTYEFEYVKVAGNAALAVVKIFQDGKQKYTDFLNLYKFDTGWKIATKTFYSHF